MNHFNKAIEEEFKKAYPNGIWCKECPTGDGDRDHSEGVIKFINARVAKRTEDIREAVEKEGESAPDESYECAIDNVIKIINKLNDDAPAS